MNIYYNIPYPASNPHHLDASSSKWMVVNVNRRATRPITPWRHVTSERLINATDDVADNNPIGSGRGYPRSFHSLLIFIYKSIYYSNNVNNSLLSYCRIAVVYSDLLNAKEKNNIHSWYLVLFTYSNRNIVRFSSFQDVTCCDFIIDCALMWRH